MPAERGTVAKRDSLGIVRRRSRRTVGKGFGLLLLGCLLGAPWPSARAEAPTPPTPTPTHLDIALGAAVTSLDPHYHRYTPNQTVARHVFDPLLTNTAGGTLVPALAVRWESPEPRAWVFHLRPGVRFHDGRPFTAQDVAASLRRPASLTLSPFSQAEALSHVTAVRTLDDLTVRLETDQPMPYLPRRLVNLLIVPATLETVPSEAFADPARSNGTGPYRLTGGDMGDSLHLTANPDYWGGRPPWDRVTLHLMPNDARRLAALLDGTVDLIEIVPPVDAARLMTNPSLRVSASPSNRLIYIGLDVGRETSPHVTGHTGDVIANPLRDAKVRQAIDLAIDRIGLLRDVLQGYGTVAGQLLAPDSIGHAPGLPPPRYALGDARALMVEAGYAKGFRLTLHCPRDRYVADVQVAETVARMLDRLGIEATAECLPAAPFFRLASDGAYSAYLAGLAIDTGDAAEALLAFLGRPSVDAPGQGALNRGGWGDAETDAILTRAVKTADSREREALVQQAVRRAANERAIIPLFFQQSIWAMRAGIRFDGQFGELTLAQGVVPVAP